MNKELIIKKLNIDNIKELLEFKNEIQESLEHKDRYGGLTFEKCLKTFEDEENLLLGIYNENDELVAYTTLKPYKNFTGKKYLKDEFKEKDYDKIYWFVNVAVKPKFRGQGIQNKVIDYHINFAKSKNAQYIIAYVHPKNNYSKNNFLNKGFNVIKTVVFDDGRTRDIIIKELN